MVKGILTAVLCGALSACAGLIVHDVYEPIKNKVCVLIDKMKRKS